MKAEFMEEKLIKESEMKFNHVGIPVTGRFEGEIDLPHLKMTVSDHENNPYGIQWQRYWDDAPYPELVKTVPHVAFVVENIEKEIVDKKTSLNRIRQAKD